MSLLLCRLLDIPLAPDTDNRSAGDSFAHYLLSITGEFRLQMHTSALYVGVFAALGIAGLLWVMAEKWQNDSEWNNRDVIWMIGFEALLAVSAILYRVGANSILTRKFAVAGTMADVFGIGVALSVPAFLWFHWHKPTPKKEKRADQDSPSTFSYAGTILGLRDFSPPHAPPANSIFSIPESKEAVSPEPLALMQPAIRLETTIPEQNQKKEDQPSKKAPVMENMNMLNLSSHPSTSRPQPETMPTASQPYPAQPAATVEPILSQPVAPTSQPAAAPQAPAYPSMSTPPSVPDRAGVPAITFRDQLFALNNSWQRIESTGKEVEDWFQNQQRRIMAHLERPVAKGHDNVEFSRDFLEQRMERIDAEWAAIRQTVRNLHRWLENGNQEKEAPVESKVW